MVSFSGEKVTSVISLFPCIRGSTFCTSRNHETETEREAEVKVTTVSSERELEQTEKYSIYLHTLLVRVHLRDLLRFAHYLYLYLFLPQFKLSIEEEEKNFASMILRCVCIHKISPLMSGE